jgi:hypothetical protein
MNMRSKLHNLYYTLFAVIACVGLLFAYKTTSGVDAKPLPRKGWTVGFHAYRISGYKSLPVKVYGVTSAGERGLEVAHVRSKSDKIVIGVRIKWFVSEKDKSSILAKGETPLLNLPGLVGAQPSFDVKVPDATLDRILRPVMKNGQLRGDFDVQVVVGEVKYLDGSFWKLPEPTNLVVVPIRKHHGAYDACPGQTCRLAPDLFSYQCADSKEEECINSGTICSSYICGLSD